MCQPLGSTNWRPGRRSSKSAACLLSPPQVFRVRRRSSKSTVGLPGPPQVFQVRRRSSMSVAGLPGPAQVFHVRRRSSRSVAGLPGPVQVRRWQLHLHVVFLSSGDCCDLVPPGGPWTCWPRPAIDVSTHAQKNNKSSMSSCLYATGSSLTLL